MLSKITSATRVAGFTLLFVLLSAAAAYAQTPIGGSNQTPVGGNAGSFDNPLSGGGIDSVEGFFLAVVQVLLIFALPIVVFFIIYAGFLMVTARGNEEQLTKGKRAIAYALVGAVLIFGAQALLEILKNTVEAFK